MQKIMDMNEKISSLENFFHEKIRQQAAQHLIQQDPDLAKIIQKEGLCRLKIDLQKEPYEALARAIAGQQLHSKAVEAIISRLLILNNGTFPSPKQMAGFSHEQLARCGFSMRKAMALQHLAQATLDNKVPNRQQANEMSDQELIDILTQLHGIGRWSVEMLLIFTLGRLDIMPVDDFGVRKGWRLCKNLPIQPKPKILRQATESWSPYRSIGAWYLWRAVEQFKPKQKQNPLTL